MRDFSDSLAIVDGSFTWDEAKADAESRGGNTGSYLLEK